MLKMLKRLNGHGEKLSSPTCSTRLEIFRELALPYKIESTDLHPDSLVSKINLTSYRQASRIYDFGQWWMCIKWCLRYDYCFEIFRTWLILVLPLSPRMLLVLLPSDVCRLCDFVKMRVVTKRWNDWVFFSSTKSVVLNYDFYKAGADGYI